MATIEIDLPYPPSVNNYWRSTNRGKFVSVYVTKEGKAFQEATKAAMWSKFGSIKPDKRRMHVEIHATMPDRRKRDVDNICKATLDGLTAAMLWVDDSQIDRLLVVRCGVKKPGGVRVIVHAIKEPPKLFGEKS